jgi:phospholipid-binding lipoprotein MlaA
MNVTKPSLLPKGHHFLLILVGCALLACTAPTPSAQINDPDEALNRKVHKFNIFFDRSILRPIATSVVKPGGGPIAQGVTNFARNLSGPADVLNNVLQLRLGKAVENTLKFAINTTVGIGGIFDPATAMGVSGSDTDFGETLHVWGFGEGRYMEVPAVGPTTVRDISGDVVDLFISPLNFLLPQPESYIGTATATASRVIDRGRYVETVDSILYESADSYAQARLLYLQNRRYALGQTVEDNNSADPYEDPYAQ